VTYEPLVDETGALAPPMSAPMQPPKPRLAPPAARERVPTIIAFPDPRPTANVPAARDQDTRRLTHLDVVLNAVRHAMPNLPAPRKPWREMLPEELPWSSIERPAYTAEHGRAGRYLALGMLDDPAAQAQYPAVFDLEEGGGLLVAGGGGSGKTTALRTAALAAVAGASPHDVALYVIDCASRSLAALRDLPHCAGVATGDDLESLTRVIALLVRELDRRRAVLSDLSVQAETLSAYLDKGHAMPRIVVLIDGFQNLASIVGNVQSMVHGPLDWLAELHRVITDGRQVGIHAVLASDRRQGVPALVMSAISHRLVLRQTDEAAYADYGVPMAIYKGLELPGGRALWNNQMVQVGLISDDPSAAAQGAAIAEFAAAARSRPERLPDGLTTAPAPDDVFVPLVASRPNHATLGRLDVFDEVVEVDFEHDGMLVVGPPRSGRTTALRQMARSLVASGYEVWSIGLGPDASGDIGGPGRHTTGRGDAVAELMTDFAALCESLPKPRPYVLVVDDVEKYGDGAVTSAYERIVKAEASRTIGAIESRFHGGYTQNTMLAEIRMEPSVLILQPETASDVLSATGVRPQLRPGYKMRAGRGVLITNRIPMIVQVAAGIES
jgi:S-DNA-T family DNA segregation ATPase FtsK/SpoIIIE